MAGLLDSFGMDTPESQAQMAMAAQLMSARKRPGEKGSFGNAMGGGLMAYMNALNAGKKNSQQAQMDQLRIDSSKMEMEDARRKREQQTRMDALIPQFYKAGDSGSPGTAGVNDALDPSLRIGAMPPRAAQAPSFDMQGYAGAMMGIAPAQGLQLLQSMQKDAPINKLDAKDFTPASLAKFAQTKNYGDLQRMEKLHFGDTGGALTAFDQFTGKPVAANPKTGDPFKDLVLSDGAGGMRVNSPLLGAKSSIAKSGATNVRIENKMGESLAKEIGPMMNDSYQNATGAAQQADAAQRIIKAVDSNKMYAGTGATVRLKATQVADLLGVAGKDAQEKILNTRATLKGLAELTLKGRQQMRGQGAITESESKLAERAVSGDLNDLTAPEIKMLAQAADRSARHVYEGHKKRMGVVQGNPSMSGLAPFYEAPPMPESAPEQAAPGMPQGFRVVR